MSAMVLLTHTQPQEPGRHAAGAMIRLRFGTTILQVRRSAACIVAACILLGFTGFYIYFSRLLPSATGLAGWSPGKVDVVALEQRLQRLERELRHNHAMLTQIRETVLNFLGTGGNAPWKAPLKPHLLWLHNATRQPVPTQPGDCAFGMLPPASTDYNMYDLYEKLAFDNPNGGVWKQGWDLQYQPDQWSRDRKLRVFVVPHSHNDPGASSHSSGR
ncbi:hypothetical protein ISCGN_004376 [Ixodes scapularis]